MNAFATALPEAQKPSFEEVSKYAKGNIRKFIRDLVSDLPFEQQEEIEQEAMLRVFRAYQELDAARGWKSFIYTHCKGAVKDYQKSGAGFSEQRWSLASGAADLKGLLEALESACAKNIIKFVHDGEEFDFGTVAELESEIHTTREILERAETRAPNMRERVEAFGDDGNALDVEQILGINGVFSEGYGGLPSINWLLLARLASTDHDLHAFALSLKGFSLEEIAPVFRLSPQRVHGMVESFKARFKVKLYFHDPRFKQILYALGLSEAFDLPYLDQSEIHLTPIGWNLDAVDLDNPQPLPTKDLKQLSFEM